MNDYLQVFKLEAKNFADFLNKNKIGYSSRWSLHHVQIRYDFKSIDVSFDAPNGECGEWHSITLPVQCLYNKELAHSAFCNEIGKMQNAMNKEKERKRKQIEEEQARRLEQDRAKYEELRQRFGE